MFSTESDLASNGLLLGNNSFFGGDDGDYATPGEYNGTEVFPGSSDSESVPHPEVLLPYSVLLGIAIYLTVVGKNIPESNHGREWILSTFGNILFILTVTRWRYLRNNSHMLLLLNLAMADLAISITGYPYTTVSGYVGRWIFGTVMCQLYAFLCFTFSQVSMNTLVAVSIFRYIAICRPHMKHLLTTRTSLWALVLVWCHALFWTVSPLLGWSSYTFEPTRISCSFDWNDRTYGGIAYVLGTTLFCYISHIGIMVFCYKRIFKMVTRLKRKSTQRDRWLKRRRNNATLNTLNSTISGLSTTEDQEPSGHMSRSTFEEEEPPDTPPGIARCQSMIIFSFVTENLTQMERHVLEMNVAMVVAFIVFWTPYAIISVVSAFYDKLSPFWYIFPTIFAKTSCMVNPFLYGLTNNFLRKQLMLVLRGFLGLTTAIEDFEVMRQRQQDGLYYNKEGVFVGKKTGAMCYCPCEGCVASRRQIKLLIEHQKAKLAATEESEGNQQDERVSVSCTGGDRDDADAGGGDGGGGGGRKEPYQEFSAALGLAEDEAGIGIGITGEVGEIDEQERPDVLLCDRNHDHEDELKSFSVGKVAKGERAVVAVAPAIVLNVSELPGKGN